MCLSALGKRKKSFASYYYYYYYNHSIQLNKVSLINLHNNKYISWTDTFRNFKRRKRIETNESEEEDECFNISVILFFVRAHFFLREVVPFNWEFGQLMNGIMNCEANCGRNLKKNEENILFVFCVLCRPIPSRERLLSQFYKDYVK